MRVADLERAGHEVPEERVEAERGAERGAQVLAVIELIVERGRDIGEQPEVHAPQVDRQELEAAIDVATTSFDPMAKLAKDMAAGAVLISTGAAAATGFLIFDDHIANPSTHLLNRAERAPVYLTLVALIVITMIVIVTKALTHRGTPLRGGLPSGHAALAFAAWMAVTYLVQGGQHRFLISSLALVMAILVAQTRVEAGFHSALEVTYGAALGALVMLAFFQVFT